MHNVKISDAVNRARNTMMTDKHPLPFLVTTDIKNFVVSKSSCEYDMEKE